MKNYIYLLIVFIIFLCICLVCKGCMNLYEGFVDGDADGISISKNLTLNTSGTNFKCDGSKPHPPQPPPPPPSSPDEPNPKPPQDFNKGYIEYKNDHPSKNIVVWFDMEKPRSTQYIMPNIKFKNNNIDNIKVIDRNGININIATVKRSLNGFNLAPGYSLFVKLFGKDTKIQSGGNYFTTSDVMLAPNTTETNRFEYTIISRPNWANGQTMYSGNYSYANGYNSYFTLKKQLKANEQYVDFGGSPNNMSDLTETTCNNNGGTYSTLAPGQVGNLNNQKNCFGPSKARTLSNEPIYKSKKYPNKDPIGCDDVQNLAPNYICNCLQTWYSRPNSEYFVNADLLKWYKYIHTNCPSAYAWSYDEKGPININSAIYNDQDWCYNRIKDTSYKTWADVAEYFKTDLNIFKEPNVLTTVPIKDGETLKILVSIKDVMS